MSSADKTKLSDTARGVRTGESSKQTHHESPHKMRMGIASSPYASPVLGTESSLAPYPEPETQPVSREQIHAIRLQAIELMTQDLGQTTTNRSRDEIAELLGVSRPTLDSWLARTRLDRMMPVTALPAWVAATGSTRLLEWVTADAGYWIGQEQDRVDAALGRKVREAAEALYQEVAA